MQPESKVRIPSEMVPPDQKALQYFDMYFTDIHPYVPVLNQRAFYSQWNTNRESISPLILEGIFALATMLLGDPMQSFQWLALIASRHFVNEL